MISRMDEYLLFPSFTKLNETLYLIANMVKALKEILHTVLSKCLL